MSANNANNPKQFFFAKKGDFIMANIYDRNGNLKYYVSENGNRYDRNGNYAGRTGSDHYNYDRNGNRTSYNAHDNFTYRMDGSKAGYRGSDGVYRDNLGRPKYYKG